MSISVISGSGIYTTSANRNSSSGISQLKAEEQRLEQELEKLKKSDSGANAQATQQEESSLEQRIADIEQQIRQTESSSSATSSQTGSAASGPAANSTAPTTSLLDTKA